MRTLSGAFFVSLVIASILIHQYIFLAVFAVIAAWAVSEFHRLTNHQPDVDVNQWLGVAGAVLATSATSPACPPNRKNGIVRVSGTPSRLRSAPQIPVCVL